MSRAHSPLGPAAEAAYQIHRYGAMIADPRTDAYAEALRRSVGNESVVLDIGTGSGIFAMLACRFGARRVFAVEPVAIIEIATELAAANGFADRIEFIRDVSTNVVLPERADVIVSDLRGGLPLFEAHLPTIIDARRRLLAENGVLIPARDTLWGALAHAPDLYESYLGVWSSRPYGFDHSPAHRLAVNEGWRARLQSDQLVTTPQRWTTLDYASLDDPDAAGTLEWEVTHAGVAHGLCLWFEATLVEGVGYSNAPGQPPGVYPQKFLPFSEPVEVAVGDVAQIRLHATFAGGSYIWTWAIEVRSADRRDDLKAAFEHSTLHAEPISLDLLT
jgi:type I protein arginine methyltransferase